MAKTTKGRGAQGAGTIRKKTVTRNGKQYQYWEARMAGFYAGYKAALLMIERAGD